MSDDEFETYLELLGRLLCLSAKQRDEISAELRDHLEQRLDELLEIGHTRPAAIKIAVEELGDAGGLAANFISITRRKRQRWAMRFATFSIVGCFIGALLIFSLWPDQDRLPLAPRTTAQESAISTKVDKDQSVEARNQRTREQLQNTILDFYYDNIPFGDLLNDLREKHDFDFYLDDSSELKSESPVTMNLRNVRLAMALDLIVREHNSQYIVRDGLILIASVDEMAELGPEIRVYNCRDLAGPQGKSFEAGLEPSPTPDTEVTPENPNQSPPKDEPLASLIKSVVSPTTWEEEGSSIVVFDGLLVVNCTPIVHQQIEELLAQLRKVSKTQPPDQSPGPK